MGKIITITLFIIMLVTLLANPAPVSIEIEDIVLIIFPLFLGIVAVATSNHYKLYAQESNLLIAIMFYLSYLLISMLIGLAHGVSLLNSLRSLGPYINFFPLLLLGFLPFQFFNPRKIAWIFISIGVLQAGYQLYLFLTHSYGGVDTLDVLRSRITLIEPRATLPIVLSVAILPMVFLSNNNLLTKCVAGFLIVLGLVAGAATLTRSIVISIVVGWITFIALSIYKQYRTGTFSFSRTSRLFSRYVIFFIAFILLLSLIPKIAMLEKGLLARFYYHTGTNHSMDYSNGRLYDEWLPALHTWMNSGVLGLFFGIGAGNVFTVASGEERTYIHNIIIYNLVYGGFYGLFACLWLYFTVFKTLLARAFQSNQFIYLGFASLLMSIFTYAQLFAVHKGLAFNAMLFLLIAIAFSQPARET